FPAPHRQGPPTGPSSRYRSPVPPCPWHTSHRAQPLVTACHKALGGALGSAAISDHRGASHGLSQSSITLASTPSLPHECANGAATPFASQGNHFFFIILSGSLTRCLPIEVQRFLEGKTQRFFECLFGTLLTVDSRYFGNPANPPWP